MVGEICHKCIEAENVLLVRNNAQKTFFSKVPCVLSDTTPEESSAQFTLILMRVLFNPPILFSGSYPKHSWVKVFYCHSVFLLSLPFKVCPTLNVPHKRQQNHQPSNHQVTRKIFFLKEWISFARGKWHFRTELSSADLLHTNYFTKTYVSIHLTHQAATSYCNKWITGCLPMILEKSVLHRGWDLKPRGVLSKQTSGQEELPPFTDGSQGGDFSCWGWYWKLAIFKFASQTKSARKFSSLSAHSITGRFGALRHRGTQTAAFITESAKKVKKRI